MATSIVYSRPTASSLVHGAAGSLSQEWTTANGTQTGDPSATLLIGDSISRGNQRIRHVFGPSDLPPQGSTITAAHISVFSKQTAGNLWTRGAFYTRDGTWNKLAPPYWGRQSRFGSWPVRLYSTAAEPDAAWDETTGTVMSESVGATINGAATGEDRSNNEERLERGGFWGFYQRAVINKSGTATLGWAKVSVQRDSTVSHGARQCWVEIWSNGGIGGDVSGSQYEHPGALLAKSEKVRLDDILDVHESQHTFEFRGANQISLTGGASYFVVFNHDPIAAASQFALRVWEKTPSADTDPIHFEEDNDEEWAGAWSPTWGGWMHGQHWQAKALPHVFGETGIGLQDSEMAFSSGQGVVLAQTVDTRWIMHPLAIPVFSSVDWVLDGLQAWYADPSFDPAEPIAIEWDARAPAAGFAFEYESDETAADASELPWLEITYTPPTAVGVKGRSQQQSAISGTAQTQAAVGGRSAMRGAVSGTAQQQPAVGGRSRTRAAVSGRSRLRRE